jgi:hypothetical protein
MTPAAIGNRLSPHGDVVMLPLLLLLVQDPSTLTGPVPPPGPGIRLRVIDAADMAVDRCDSARFQRIDGPSGTSGMRSDLSYRPDGEVRRYLLLDRTVRGCPAPISYALPGGQNGFIRELGRTAPPDRSQPPRSSE